MKDALEIRWESGAQQNHCFVQNKRQLKLNEIHGFVQNAGFWTKFCPFLKVVIGQAGHWNDGRTEWNGRPQHESGPVQHHRRNARRGRD
jgi:hypothetical protein